MIPVFSLVGLLFAQAAMVFALWKHSMTILSLRMTSAHTRSQVEALRVELADLRASITGPVNEPPDERTWQELTPEERLVRTWRSAGAPEPVSLIEMLNNLGTDDERRAFVESLGGQYRARIAEEAAQAPTPPTRPHSPVDSLFRSSMEMTRQILDTHLDGMTVDDIPQMDIGPMMADVDHMIRSLHMGLGLPDPHANVPPPGTPKEGQIKPETTAPHAWERLFDEEKT